MQKISTFLWFDGSAEEATRHYVETFPDSKITNVARQGAGEDAPVFIVNFELFGRHFQALNGGPSHSFTPAISIFVTCEDQDEVDRYWSRLSHDPAAERCGWCKDRWGLSWQIIPRQLMELAGGPDAEAGGRVMQAMLGMKKIDVAGLEAAYQGE